MQEDIVKYAYELIVIKRKKKKKQTSKVVILLTWTNKLTIFKKSNVNRVQRDGFMFYFKLK